jgi:acetyl-CoA C-acetyltransferase
VKEIVLAGACRTAIGKFGGSLAEIPAHCLGSLVIAESLKRGGVSPEAVDEIIFGNVLQLGQGQGPARQAAIKAGVPESTPAMTINKICSSGLRSITLAAAHCQQVKGWTISKTVINENRILPGTVKCRSKN